MLVNISHILIMNHIYICKEKIKWIVELKIDAREWVPVSSTGKVFDGCIRDLRFNHRLHQKLIGVLV